MPERTHPQNSGTVKDGSDGLVLTSVWPTGTAGVATQLAEGGYHDATGADPALMPPAIARHAIATFTRPGDVVLDPDCGTGTTIVEALRCGRHAIGLTGQRRWWRLARMNVTVTKARGAFADGMVLILDRRPGTSAAATTAGLTSRVSLLLTTLRLTAPNTDTAAAVARVRQLLAQYRPLLRPGGHVVITCPPWRHTVQHDLLDLPGQIVAAGSAAGLAPIARCEALTATVRRGCTHTRATLAQRRVAARAERALGHPITLPAHHTALVFRADPDARIQHPAQPMPLRPAPTGPHHLAPRNARMQTAGVPAAHRSADGSREAA
jgi:modification methylase